MLVGYIFTAVFLTATTADELCLSYDEESDPCPSPCQPTCEEPTPPYSSHRCTIKSCAQACVCQDHLLRDTNSGQCILSNECPLPVRESVPECEDENEEYNWCASWCPRTCQSPCRNITGCMLSCNQRCDCKSGFIRDEVLGKCVEVSKCPSCKCPENQVWTSCEPQCAETCYSLNNPQNCDAVNSCLPGCTCPPGLFLNEETRKCVPRNKCPATS